MMNKKDIRNIIIIISVFLIYVLSIILSKNTYISQVDFISQHFRISEYFRTLFYSNFNLFPNFAYHLGAGQNIFYLSYHSLFSPITFISYLLPFIKMSTFIVLSNIILVILSIIFFYKFLKNKFNTNITTISTFIFTFAGPLIYHTHRHVMFNNYILFLILALISVDTYFDKNKKSPLIISVLLIILTSYYYSVTSIITLCIYALYKYLKTTKKIDVKNLLKELIKFVLTLFVPILISAFLLIPTVYALKNGRSDTLNNINILSLLIPKFTINNFMYQSYSVGLSAILIFSIIDNILSKKKENITLSIISIIILIFPIICYILNGFMYVDGKCFIPLLPLFCFMIANTLNNITKKNYNMKLLLIIASIVMIISIITNLDYKFLVIYIIDNIILIISFLLYKKKNNFKFIAIPIVLFSLGVFIVINNNDKLVSKDTLNTIDNINENVNINYNISYRSANLFYILENVNNVIDKNYYTTSIYSSTSNSYYTNFIRNVFKNEVYNKDYHTLTQSSSILFNMYMANMYLITNKDKIGYTKTYDNVYKNEDVYTVGYASSNLMSKEEFDRLDYPYNIDALMKYTIVDKDISSKYDNSDVYKYNGNYEILDTNLDYQFSNNNYIFDVEDNANLKIKLDDYIKDKIILVSFDMNYNDNIDTSITINDVKNTLSFKGWKYHNNNYTFHYTLDSSNILDISISKGHYEISNINVYVLDYNNYKNINKKHDKFIIDSINNNIKGSINVKEDSYFTLSIPYDKGFNIKVDGKEVSYELVNTSFIGFELDKGYHEIEISYTAPLYKLGVVISIIGVIIYVLILWKGWRNEKN